MTTGEKVMKILADTHTHTIASTHAYSTVAEMARAAHDAGLEAIAVTDHGMMLPDAPHSWHFHNLKNIPREICGVKILYGIEANILDLDGNIDPLEDEIYKKLDIVNASIHSPCYAAERGGDHTGAYLNIVNDPRVDVICHSGTAAYPYDYERIIKLAGENRKRGRPCACPSGDYAAVFSKKRMRMAAAWARVALPLGSSVTLSTPLIRPFSTAQATASSA